MSSELIIKEKKVENLVEVFISGEVDIYTSQSLKDRLYEIVGLYKLDLIIDCSNLNYIDSTGLGIMVGALKRAKLNGNDIYLENLKDSIKKLFLITGLDKLFIIK